MQDYQTYANWSIEWPEQEISIWPNISLSSIGFIFDFALEVVCYWWQTSDCFSELAAYMMVHLKASAKVISFRQWKEFSGTSFLFLRHYIISQLELEPQCNGNCDERKWKRAIGDDDVHIRVIANCDDITSHKMRICDLLC